MLYNNNNQNQPYDQAGFSFNRPQNNQPPPQGGYPYQQQPPPPQGSYSYPPPPQGTYSYPPPPQGGNPYQQPPPSQGSYSYPPPPQAPQGAYQPPPYTQAPMNPKYNPPNPYAAPTSQPTAPTAPTAPAPSPYANQRATSYDSYAPPPSTQYIQRSASYDAYSQPPVSGPGDPYRTVPYNGNPYPQQQPYHPGDPYLVVPYNNQPYQPQPYNLPMPNSAPVFYQPPPQYFQEHKISSCTGNKKALLIGINYLGTRARLNGCINDTKNMKEFIMSKFGFTDSPGKMIVLTDDQKEPLKIPTRKNIINAMKWLVNNCKPGDSLFFYFSGHGGQVEDEDGDEVDGYDETIIPVDFDFEHNSGHIVDDEMNAIMVKNLPEGVRLTAIFDSCHSGTALDLPYIYGDDGKLVIQKGPSSSDQFKETILRVAIGDVYGAVNSAMKMQKIDKLNQNSDKIRKKAEETRSTQADVIMFSGCEDSESSIDANVNDQYTGAMSYAFIKACMLNNDLSYLELLKETKKHLKELNDKRNIEFKRDSKPQRPQLSTGRLMDMHQKFIM